MDVYSCRVDHTSEASRTGVVVVPGQSAEGRIFLVSFGNTDAIRACILEPAECPLETVHSEEFRLRRGTNLALEACAAWVERLCVERRGRILIVEPDPESLPMPIQLSLYLHLMPLLNVSRWLVSAVPHHRCLC